MWALALGKSFTHRLPKIGSFSGRPLGMRSMADEDVSSQKGSMDAEEPKTNTFVAQRHIFPTKAPIVDDDHPRNPQLDSPFPPRTVTGNVSKEMFALERSTRRRGFLNADYVAPEERGLSTECRDPTNQIGSGDASIPAATRSQDIGCADLYAEQRSLGTRDAGNWGIISERSIRGWRIVGNNPLMTRSRRPSTAIVPRHSGEAKPMGKVPMKKLRRKRPFRKASNSSMARAMLGNAIDELIPRHFVMGFDMPERDLKIPRESEPKTGDK